jgi:hypothetical protein
VSDRALCRAGLTDPHDGEAVWWREELKRDDVCVHESRWVRCVGGGVKIALLLSWDSRCFSSRASQRRNRDRNSAAPEAA